MEKSFDHDLTAVWLVFGGSYLNHSNAPKGEPDFREQTLVNLLNSFLAGEVEIYPQLATVRELLTLWSKDLDLIYEIRNRHDNEKKIRRLAQWFLHRIQSLESFTIIPNGLISSEQTGPGHSENVCLAVVQKQGNHINWTQVDPSSGYHQHCNHVVGEKSNAYLTITEINPDNITEDWLYLLAGLKSVRPRGSRCYQNLSLYECLLSHLNGKTAFQSEPDEGFIVSSLSSPVHTWQVIDKSFCCLLQLLLGDTYFQTYQHLVINFKLFLMEKTFDAFQSKNTKQLKECHFLLQEMSQHIAGTVLDQGSTSQKQLAFQRITTIKTAIEQHCIRQERRVRRKSQLDEPCVKSLAFDKTHLKNHTPSGIIQASSLNIESNPVFTKPTETENIIDYLVKLKCNFIERLITATDINKLALLNYGFECFFIEFLSKTNILEKSTDSFSKDDSLLARLFLEMAEIYCSIQSKLVKDFFSNMTSEFYTKNLILQFFVYAATVSLNRRDPKIGPLIASYDFSTDINGLKLLDIIPSLVINDFCWLKVLLDVKAFFRPRNNKEKLFSKSFSFEVSGIADRYDTDIIFAYQLLQKDPAAEQRFLAEYSETKGWRPSHKWAYLAYTDDHLPPLYSVLSKVANLAKASLIGLQKPGKKQALSLQTAWYIGPKDLKEKSCKPKVLFRINNYLVSSKSSLNMSISGSTEGSYQDFITRKLENKIIASQDEKPETMGRNRYLQLGFLQSEPEIKLERLYLAIKEKQLDFGCNEESILIKKTLFEISLLKNREGKTCSLLEWTCLENPTLIHKFGLLCIKRALEMQHRITQHHAIGEILLVTLGLLTFYPTDYKDIFLEGIMSIYRLLKETLAQPPTCLSDNTLLHLNAYLLIAVQAKPQLLGTDISIVLKALLDIQNFKVKGANLDNTWLLQVYRASFSWCSLVEDQLEENPTLLNDLMLSINSDWDQASTWIRSKAGLLFSCNDHAIEPLLGCIYFQNKQMMGLPSNITGHNIFKECLGDLVFPVTRSYREINSKQTMCYISVDCTPQIRLTKIRSALLIEKLIGYDYERYIPAEELLEYSDYPRLLSESPHAKEKLRHWLDKDENILIKDKQQNTIFKWDLSSNFIYSLEQKGYLVPWDELQDSSFKTWLERFEPGTWIELIAKPDSLRSVIHIQSLNFPRLGIHFYSEQGNLCSKQIHNYVVAKQQYLNTLHGFSNYLVLENKEQNPVQKCTKVIIPHRKVTPKKGPLYDKKTTVDFNEVRSPAYFVYDYDAKIGLLKGHHIRAHLYLALLYFRTASFDDHDASHCNSYHLARENLELCWKNEPYDSIELDIIDQFLDISAMRCLHSHSIALYLKVVSLLSQSLKLAFLFMDEISQVNKERSGQLLNKCARQSPDLLSMYLQNKLTIFARVRLTLEEEEDAKKHCSVPFLSTVKNSYNSHYREFFSEKTLTSTEFISIFKKYTHLLYFDRSPREINFSSGINGILKKQFRIGFFIVLYKLAKASSVTLTKYRYLLHHLLIKAEIDPTRLPAELADMLVRVLLLVAENPTSFPSVPNWFDESEKVTVNLSKRQLIKDEVLKKFPIFCWEQDSDEDTGTETSEDEEAVINEDDTVEINEDENRDPDDDIQTESDEVRHAEPDKAEIAKQQDQDENEQIWKSLESHDLNRHGVPRGLPLNPDRFSLRCEKYIDSNDSYRLDDKLEIVKECYLQSAYNDSFYQFFVRVLKKCDELKHDSEMGWTVAPFIHETIMVTLEKEEEQILPIPEPMSLAKWAAPSPPLIELHDYFAVISQPAENSDFVFESQRGEINGYQQKFCDDLKDSWTAFINEPKCSYSWHSPQSVDQLKSFLQSKYDKIHSQAKKIWNQIEARFKLRTNTELNNYFALRWYSGEVRHYHKRDILRSLAEPHKLLTYNPDCIESVDPIIQELLQYLTLEIIASKIVRALALIIQYKQAETEPEEFSALQSLVRSLQENLDPESYRHPHWFLFQFENEIIIRENQRELILAMLNQNEKAMYQLNMGEGKSSVVLPLLSHSLANGRQLLRINVLSPLLTTMKEFLRQRFSGLIRKNIYNLPFNRDTDISTYHLQLIFETLRTCQNSQHFLLVTPEDRMCLQLKIRELMLESQQQIGATNIFNWETYRKRVHDNTELYQDLGEEKMDEILKEQDEFLKTCLRKKKYIDENNQILKIPPRGQGFKEFALLKDTNKNSEFREWSCLKAAYGELLYNSTLAQEDCSKKLALLNEIDGLTAIDLLDESDEILKHGTELNYTMGDKHVFAGGKLRWEIPQFFIKAIFCDTALRDAITTGRADGFTAININFNSQSGVPFIQFLNESYFEDHIKPLLIDKFFQENLRTLQKYNYNADSPVIAGTKSSLRKYVAGKLPLNVERKVIGILSDKGPLKDKLLVAKGWLSHGILYHVFNAKYRVQFGLNLNAQGEVLKQIAIPFFGKDAPSFRSEFSHPDVMLGFTIISYLYQGLNQAQLQKAVNKLKSEFCYKVADTYLSSWTEAGRTWIQSQSNEFPPLLLTSIQNLDVTDKQCLKSAHQYLSKNYQVVFFYLNQFVLLEEAMQYIYKISANAHSLVGSNAALGFSGTDDRKITMPFQVKSLRSYSQAGTNGKLLSVLTQERNSNYYSLEAEDTVDSLKKFCDYARTQQHCHALIDAGALVTGLSNYAVAEYLLAHLPSDFLGILYFSDEGNSLTVLTRDRKITALQDCYLDNESLFIYLDDIHTRGTDLKLPSNCHAILTIGMAMQKDKLMQAAMRLRQLAEKQSVSLWGTQAVTFAIARDNAVDLASINSLEVIKWVTRNTIDNINEDLFHVAVRSINFQLLKKAEAWLKEAPISLDTLVKCCKEKELFLLEEFYALSPQCEDLANRLDCFVTLRLRSFWRELEEELRSKKSSGTVFYKKVCDKSSKIDFRNLLFTICGEVASYLPTGYVRDSLDNDEEKEVEVEVEQEQEKKIVPKVSSRKDKLENRWHARSRLKKDFIISALEDDIIMPLDTIEEFILMPADLKNVIWHEDIYMTSNFIDSVHPLNEKLDNYLRPVDVVLMHRFNGKSVAVLLSGQEASLIKSTCSEILDSNLLIHINDEINGPTQLPVGSTVSKEEQKLLTIIKLFSGECNYTSFKEVQRIAKRVGRIYPQFFACSNVSVDISKQLFDSLKNEGYLDFAGVMTEKLLTILRQVGSEDSLSLKLPVRYQLHNQFLLEKLHRIFSKLIISSSNPLKESHNILCQWVETRGRLTEYSGSALESILDPENDLKCSG